VKEQLVNTRIHWGQPPTGWDAPGWAPLVDPGPYSFQTARSVGRWLWPTLAVSAFLAVVGFVLGHDDPTPGLSVRGLLTITLAAAVVVLLTIRRAAGPGPLVRAIAEYAMVFLLAVLIATTGLEVNQAPAASEHANVATDHRPALIKTVVRAWDRLVGAWNWLAELWRRADQATDRPSRPPSPTTPKGEAMGPAPASLPSTPTRRPL
jgi:hypothetical protein